MITNIKKCFAIRSNLITGIWVIRRPLIEIKSMLENMASKQGAN